MKILIIANLKGVFGKELKNELIENGADVSLLGFENLEIVDKNNIVENKYSKLLKKYGLFSKLKMITRMFLINKIMEDNDFDVINIHFARWYYVVILPWLSTRRYIISFYGSDFYRSSYFSKKLQYFLYKSAESLTFTNPITRNSFLEFYGEFKNKAYICRFGLKTLEYIDKNRFFEKKLLKKQLGYNPDKITVTCGYNSTKEQQHVQIIKNIMVLPKDLLCRVQFIFPFTYGDQENKEVVKSFLKRTDLDYIVLEEYLYGLDNANIKLASDIMINMLKTDSFSGSMQEFLYANNIVITGKWLPYEIFDEAGVDYIRIDKIDDLNFTLNEVVSKKLLYFNAIKNVRIISDLSKWEHAIQGWLDVYKK